MRQDFSHGLVGAGKVGPRQARFTLIELLVVVTIIAVLAALLLPALAQARVAAKRSICLSQMKQVGMGLMVYHDDNDAWMPVQASSTEWQTLLVPYVTRDVLFGTQACPEIYRLTNPNNPELRAVMGNCNLMGNTTYAQRAVALVNPSTTFLVCCGFWGAANSPSHFDQIVGAAGIAGGGYHLPWDGAGLNFHFADGHGEWAPYRGSVYSVNAPTRWWKGRSVVNAAWWRSNYEVFGP